MDTDIPRAISMLAKRLNEDPGYYYGWQANIAVCFQDEAAKVGLPADIVHTISNEAAKNFLNMLCGMNLEHKEKEAQVPTYNGPVMLLDMTANAIEVIERAYRLVVANRPPLLETHRESMVREIVTASISESDMRDLLLIPTATVEIHNLTVDLIHALKVRLYSVGHFRVIETAGEEDENTVVVSGTFSEWLALFNDRQIAGNRPSSKNVDVDAITRMIYELLFLKYPAVFGGKEGYLGLFHMWTFCPMEPIDGTRYNPELMKEIVTELSQRAGNCTVTNCYCPCDEYLSGRKCSRGLYIDDVSGEEDEK